TWAALEGVPGFALEPANACSLDELFLSTLFHAQVAGAGDTAHPAQPAHPAHPADGHAALDASALVAALDAGERDARALQPAAPPLPDALGFPLPAELQRHVEPLLRSFTRLGGLVASAAPSWLPRSSKEPIQPGDEAALAADLAALRASLLGALRLNPLIKL